ncbi:MAG: hypothetical protein JWP27_2575 [Flaviaesturariibacter sp.]|nr:hypothetical protein [Flaviaesturariibacter sp.]
MNRILLTALAAIFLVSCGPGGKQMPALLSPASFPGRTLVIDNRKDTLLRTEKGALLRIKAGTFGNDAQAKLELKEAYSLPDMIRAGLLTRSGDKPLRSGGMILLRRTDGSNDFSKPIGVSLPTDRCESDMQLYKGVEEEDGIDWVHPEPLGDGAGAQNLARGKALFAQNCATCHDIAKDLTGPALANFEYRGPWKDTGELFAYIRNPAGYMTTSAYAKCLQSKYGAIMPAFPALGEDNVTAIADYVKSETQARGIPAPPAENLLCADSCRRYDSALTAEMRKRAALIRDNGPRIRMAGNAGVSPAGPDDGGQGSVPKVEPKTYAAVYYQFDIDEGGWYNVDAALDFANGASTLKVRMEAAGDYDLFIAVPQYKVFGRGGLLKDEMSVYGFYTTDGICPLPRGTTVIVFAVSEQSEGILFDAHRFVFGADNQFTLHPRRVSKERFNSVVEGFTLTGLSMVASDSKNANEIRKVDKELDRIERLRPKTCPCQCDPANLVIDSMPVTFSRPLTGTIAGR